MVVAVSVLHMNAGDGETSYASNSNIQKNLINKAKPLVEFSINQLFNSAAANQIVPNACFKIADFGCSSGPNTFSAVGAIISFVHDLCLSNNLESPEFQVYLNDLPGNDFNSNFTLTPAFYEELKKEKGEKLGRVFVAGVPGSFYGRLFPCNSLHFAHSSTCLHWLSQVPDGIEGNKGCVTVSIKSPPHVVEAYKKQFEKDFSLFLASRGKEIVSGGRMALEFLGRCSADPTKDCYLRWQLLADCLLEMASEGLVKEEDIDSFNAPYYTPYVEEARCVIEEEGSFSIEKLVPIQVSADQLSNEEDKAKSGKLVAEAFRAAAEPMLTSYFGSHIIDDLFSRFEKRVVALGATSKGTLVVLGISLARK